MADNQAPFNEVVQVTVDVQKFQAGLEELRQVYAEFVKSLGDEANGVIGAGVFAGLKEQIKALVEDSQTVQAALVDAVTNAAAKIEEISNALESKLSAKSKKKIEEAEAVGKAQAEAAKLAAEAEMAAQDAVIDHSSEKKVPRTQNLQAQIDEARLQATTALQKEAAAAEEAAAAAAAKAEQQAYEIELARLSLLDRYAVLRKEENGSNLAAMEAALEIDRERLAIVKESTPQDQTAKTFAAYQQNVNDRIKLVQQEKEQEAALDRKLSEQRTALFEKEAAARRQALNQDTAAQEATAKRLEQEAAQREAAGQAEAVAEKQAYEIELARMALLERYEALRKLENGSNLVALERALELDRERVALLQQTTPVDDTAKQLAAHQAYVNARIKAVQDEAKLNEQAEQQRLKALEQEDALRSKIAKEQLDLVDKLNRLYKEMYRAGAEAADLQIKAEKDRIALAEIAKQPLDTQLSLLAAKERVVDAERKSVGAINDAEKGTSSLLAKTIQAYAVWTAFAAVIHGITAIIEAPFKAFADGLKYLEDTEAIADKLTGVLNANVKYSSDVAENFKKSREAAAAAAVEIQNMSAKLGVSVESLTRTFEALSDAGGARVVKNTKDLLDVTGLLTVALEATGRSANNTRSIISELPRFLDGTLPPTSALLHALGLSTEQAKALVAQAKEHGNLLELLAPKLTPYLTAVQEMQFHHDVALRNLKLTAEQLAGIAAKPAFDLITQYLREANKWLVDNKEVLTKWLNLIGEIVKKSLEALRAYVDMLGPVNNLVAGFAKLLVYASAFVFQLKAAAELADGTADILDGKAGKGVAKLLLGYVDANNALKDSLALLKKIDDIQSGKTKTAGDNGKDPLQYPVSDNVGSRPDLNKARADRSRELENEFRLERDKLREHVDSVKASYAELIHATQEQEAARQLSHRDGAKLIAQYSAEEKNQLDSLVNTFVAKTAELREKLVQQATARGQDPKAEATKLADELLNIQRQLEKDKKQSDDAVSAARKAANSEEVNEKTSHANTLLQIQKDYLSKELTLAKEQLQGGYLTRVEYLDKEIALTLKSQALQEEELNKEIAAYALGTDKRTQAVNKKQLVEEQFTEKMRELGQQRINADNAELVAKQQYFDKIAAEELKQQQTLTQLAAAGHGSSKALDQDLLEAQRREIDLLIQETQQNLVNAEAKNANSDATRKLKEQLQGLYEQRLTNAASAANRASTLFGGNSPVIQSINSQGALKDAFNSTSADLFKAQGNLQQFDANHGLDLSPEEERTRAALEDLVKTLTEQKDKIKDALDSTENSFSDGLSTALDRLVKFSVSEAWDHADTNLKKLAVGSEVVGGALKAIPGIIGSIQQGLKNGGALGGVGAGLSAVSGLLSDVPVVGQFLPGVGAALSLIGSLFTNAAKAIADDAKKKFDETIATYNQGKDTLVNTINSLEQQRQALITSLSGKKGGQDQLKTLLPQFDSQIASLQKTQHDLITNFENTLGQLKLQSDTLGSINQQWDQINQSVKDYINAGGDAVKAQEFISLSLQKMQADAQQSLNQGQQQAIKDAISLNDLLNQRLQLDQQYNQQVFDLTNKDAIERQKAGSVSRAEQLKALKDQYDQQSAALTSQISLTQQKVDKETQVFNIATEISDLHIQDNNLTLAALDVQIQKYKDLQKIISSISLNSATGLYGAGGGLFNNAQFTIPITVNVNGGSSGATGDAIASSIADQLQQKLRSLPAIR